MSSASASTTFFESPSQVEITSKSLSSLVQHVRDNNNKNDDSNTDTPRLLKTHDDAEGPQLHHQSNCQHHDIHRSEDSDDDNSFSLPSSADGSGSASSSITTTNDEKHKNDNHDDDNIDNSSASLSSTARTDNDDVDTNENSGEVDDTTPSAAQEEQEEATCPQQQRRAQPPFTITSATSMRQLFPAPPQEPRFFSSKGKIQNESSPATSADVSPLRSDHYYQMILNKEYYGILSQTQVRKWESEHFSARQEYDNLIFAAHIRNIQKARASRPEEAGSFSPWGASVSHFGGDDGGCAVPPPLLSQNSTNQSQ